MRCDELPYEPPLSVARWEPLTFDARPELPVIDADDVVSLVPGTDLWDCWPLAHEDGHTVVHAGRQWWFFLSSPSYDDPIDRHGQARIRLLSLGTDGWRDHGNAFADGFTPGTREWAGSAVLLDDGLTVTLFFTAAGRRDMPPSFEQRIFASDGQLSEEGPGNWQTPREIFSADGLRYVLNSQETGAVGQIKGFRDPAWLRDPATGKCHILFTGSAAWSDDPFNGVIGIATLEDGEWRLGDPVVEAVGINNELERPHVLFRNEHYYLFWSTQRRTFSLQTVAGPNGLYAMVSESLTGPWRPVNGNGLVACNPLSEPEQAYSWWVTGEDEVWSFVDYWGMCGRRLADHPELLRAQFGGTPAPRFRLVFDADSVFVATGSSRIVAGMAPEARQVSSLADGT